MDLLLESLSRVVFLFSFWWPIKCVQILGSSKSGLRVIWGLDVDALKYASMLGSDNDFCGIWGTPIVLCPLSGAATSPPTYSPTGNLGAEIICHWTNSSNYFLKLEWVGTNSFKNILSWTVLSKIKACYRFLTSIIHQAVNYTFEVIYDFHGLPRNYCLKLLVSS